MKPFQELLGREQRLRVRAIAIPKPERVHHFHPVPPDNNLETKFLDRDCAPLLLRRNRIQRNAEFESPKVSSKQPQRNDIENLVLTHADRNSSYKSRNPRFK